MALSVTDKVDPNVVDPVVLKVVTLADPGVVPPILKLSKLPTVPELKLTALELPARLTLKFDAPAPPLADILKLPLTATL